MTFPDDMIERLRAARAVVVLTGAGVSAESGLPTFRDAMTGLWSRHNPRDLATPEAFELDPVTVTSWYDHRRLGAMEVVPNAGHHALAELGDWLDEHGGKLTVVTQNVDRLHQRAGSADVVELHGSLMRWRCVRCGDWRDEAGPAFDEHPPRCDDCGGLRRPDVVWFGEPLPTGALSRAIADTTRCDLFMTVGTSGVVYPAAGLLDVALDAGAATIEINPEPTPATERVAWSVRGPGGRLLPELLKSVCG